MDVSPSHHPSHHPSIQATFLLLYWKHYCLSKANSSLVPIELQGFQFCIIKTTNWVTWVSVKDTSAQMIVKKKKFFLASWPWLLPLFYLICWISLFCFFSPLSYGYPSISLASLSLPQAHLAFLVWMLIKQGAIPWIRYWLEVDWTKLVSRIDEILPCSQLHTRSPFNISTCCFLQFPPFSPVTPSFISVFL